MKLIAENESDNKVLEGLRNLISDLGIKVDALYREDAISLVYWSSNDFVALARNLNQKSKTEFLLSIENKLACEMISIGYEVIADELDQVAVKGIS